MQEMFKRTTIGKSDFNKVTFLHGFSPIDLLRVRQWVAIYV